MPAAGEASATIQIRPAVRADAPALTRINRRARQAAMPWLREVRTEAEVAAWLATTLIARHRVLAAAAADPLAYIGFGPTAGQEATVFDLYVDPSWQRCGLGGRLLRMTIRETGCTLALRCFARNLAARGFHERHGFRVAACGDGSDNEEGEADISYLRPANTSTGDSA